MPCHCRAGVLSSMCVLTAVGVLAGVVDSACRKLVDPLPETPRTGAPAQGAQPAPGDTSGPAEHAGPASPLGLDIGLADAKRFYDQGVPFLDARPDHEWVLGTISGAIHLPPAQFNTDKTNAILVAIDMQRPVVIFCAGGECDDSRNLAALMKAYGYTQLHILTDGFPAWQKAGYDVDVPTAAPGAGGN